MTVHKVQGVDAGGYASYLGATPAIARRGDYYLGHDGCAAEAPGRWHGKGAAALGLEGPVDRPDLMAVWEGRDLRTGEIAVRRSARGEHVAAVDCTFSAPKSVSVIWATSGPAARVQIECAQDAAVLTAIDHIEATAPLTRQRVEGEITHLQSAGLVAARFRHQTARASAVGHAAGTAPDPQIHDHVAIANMALRVPKHLGAAPEWGAIDSRELYRIAAEAGAVYRTELAHQLQELGYAVHREGRYFELDGVSESTRRAFSSRTIEVEAARREFTERYGRSPTDVEAKSLTLGTRCTKGATPSDAFNQWRDTARLHGFDAGKVNRTWARRGSALGVEAAGREVAEELTDPTSDRYLSRNDAAFDTRQLRIAVAEAAQGRVAGSDVSALIQAVEQRPEFVPVSPAHWTTRAMLDAETEVLTTARHLAERTHGGAGSDAVSHAINTARVPLSVEQEAAVRGLTQPGGLHLLTAPAGAGKGEVLHAAAAAHRADGHRVLAVAAAGETAERFQHQLEAETSCTVDALIWRIEHGHLALTDRDVVLVDEAALLETTRWRDLLRSTGEATVIAAGDAEQLPAIEAGGMWRVLERDVPTERLSENFRAHDAWARDAWGALRNGASPDALEAFDERGRITIAGTRAEARDCAVDLWDRERIDLQRQGGDLSRLLLLSDSSNVEVDRLNHGAQQRLLQAGQLHTPAVDITTQHQDTTRSERLHTGDRVVMHRRITNEDGVVVARNGATGRVSAAEPDANRLHIALDSGRDITVEPPDLPAVRLGYARHVYAAQGTTVDRAVLVTGGWQTGRESSYVGVSRAREASHVVSDYSSLGVAEGDRPAAMQALAGRMSQRRSKLSATELLDAHRGLDAQAAQPADRPQPQQPQSGKALEQLAEHAHASDAEAVHEHHSEQQPRPEPEHHAEAEAEAKPEQDHEAALEDARRRYAALVGASSRDATKHEEHDDRQEREEQMRRDREEAEFGNER